MSFEDGLLIGAIVFILGIGGLSLYVGFLKVIKDDKKDWENFK